MISDEAISNLLLIIIVGSLLYSYFLENYENVVKVLYKPETVEETQAKRVGAELGLKKSYKRYANNFLDPDRPLVEGEIP